MTQLKKHQYNYIWVIITLIILAGLSAAVYYATRSKPVSVNNAAHAPKISSTPSSPGSQPTTTPTDNTNSSNPGGVIDENGQSTSSLPPSSDWTSSSNGDITLQDPTANSSIKNGDSLVGTANTSNVSFKLYDNADGLIDQGTISVNNGKFSAKMEFTAHSTTGTLQLYYSNPVNGAEEDMLEIDVNFSS